MFACPTLLLVGKYWSLGVPHYSTEARRQLEHFYKEHPKYCRPSAAWCLELYRYIFVDIVSELHMDYYIASRGMVTDLRRISLLRKP